MLACLTSGIFFLYLSKILTIFAFACALLDSAVVTGYACLGTVAFVVAVFQEFFLSISRWLVVIKPLGRVGMTRWIQSLMGKTGRGMRGGAKRYQIMGLVSPRN